MRPIRPMLAVSGDPFSSGEWIFEPKIDGTRCIAHISKGRAELQNRRLRWISPRYPEILDSLARGTMNCVLDGEIAVFDEEIPDFFSLAQREHQTNDLRIEYLSKSLPATYIVFDVLYVEGENVMDRPLIERKEILKEVLQETDSVTITDYIAERGEAYYQAAVELGLEGIVAKLKSSQYLPGTRSSDWMKIKKSLSVDLVVGGYIPGKGHREPYFGGLMLGAYDSGGELIYVGRVGSGFSKRELEEITRSFQPSPKSPFYQPSSPSPSGVKWLEPQLVVEVEALELTSDRHLRAPIFLRVREDKPADECSIRQLWIEGSD
ncbi:MAG: non-homologous end-joining DNA ligase [Methanothrix sp.]|jgi:DNA ligase D-like protein (predicted ligase)